MLHRIEALILFYCDSFVGIYYASLRLSRLSTITKLHARDTEIQMTARLIDIEP